MTITCPNCGEELEFSRDAYVYGAICDCGFTACVDVSSVIEPERWEETE